MLIWETKTNKFCNKNSNRMGRAVLCPARFEHVSPVTERQFATMSYADPLNETKIQKLCRKNSNRRAGLWHAVLATPHVYKKEKKMEKGICIFVEKFNYA